MIRARGAVAAAVAASKAPADGVIKKQGPDDRALLKN
jgi:hypothetical protein